MIPLHSPYDCIFKALLTSDTHHFLQQLPHIINQTDYITNFLNFVFFLRPCAGWGAA